MKNDRTYLEHILESIARVEEYVSTGKDAFLNSTMIQDAVLRNLQTLGQSALRISENLRDASPDIAWRSIIAFRNVLVHDYLGISLQRV
jgi:uncharacterized protein with HEPN domain